MKNLTTNSIILVVVVLIVIIGVSATVMSMRKTREKIDDSKQTTESVTNEENSKSDLLTVNEQKEEKISESDSKNVRVIAPQPKEKISSPYSIRGEAIAFEGTVNYTLTDQDGKVLADGFTTAVATEMGEYGDFNQPITFSTQAASGTLEVYTLSAKDGSKQDEVKVDVLF